MNDIIQKLKNYFLEKGTENIYTAYDRIPVKNKGGFFTVIMVREYEAGKPVYSDRAVYIPLKAVLSVILTAPSGCTDEEIWNYYENNLEGVTDRISAEDLRLKSIKISRSKELERPVLTAGFEVCMMKTVLRGDEENDD